MSEFDQEVKKAERELEEGLVQTLEYFKKRLAIA